MVAGEASGDLLGGLLLAGCAALAGTAAGGHRRAQDGRRRASRPGGPMRQAGVRGYVEVLRHYREIGHPPPGRAAAGRTAAGLHRRRRARLQPRARTPGCAPAGIKTVHFVCPSIWAWRGGASAQAARSCDHVLCLFPFEPRCCTQHGVAATYVGHPLADAIPLEPPRGAARAALGLADRRHRGGAAARQPAQRDPVHRPRLAAAAVLMQRAAARAALRAAGGAGAARLVEPMVAQHGAGRRCSCSTADSHEALAACDVTLIASGTATLEAALFKRPMVIGYNMHR
jgi:lipid-A-disaccharide synthase